MTGKGPIVFVKRFAVVLAMLCGIAASAFAASPAAAQEADYDLQIQVLTCDATSCDDVEPVFLADAEVVVMSETGEEYGTCTTVTDVKPGGCSVMVPAGSTVEVAVLTESIPDGYVALDSPQTYQVPEEKTGVGDVSFYLTLQDDTVPDDQDTDEEVADDTTGEEAADDPVEGEADATPNASELPSTGSGPSSSTPAGLIAAIAIVPMIAAAAGTLLIRRARTGA